MKWRVLLVGAGARAARLETEIAARPESGLEIVGVVDESLPTERELESRIRCTRRCACAALYGPLSRLGELVSHTRPDRIVIALKDRRGQLPVDDLLIACRRGIVVQDASELYASLTGKMPLEWLSVASLTVGSRVRRSPGRAAIDRIMSLLVGALGLVILSPLIVAIAIAIRLDSRGPILFRQRRIGLDGQSFSLLKFRSMRSADGDRSEWVADNEDRITPVGRVLRRFRLDELPQLVNLLAGEMNLVGPRPHPVAHFDLLSRSIPFYELRTAVRPGITGWAQVKYGYANDLEEEIEKMRYDLYYVTEGSLSLDLQIVLETVRTVFAGAEEPADRTRPKALEIDRPSTPVAVAATAAFMPVGAFRGSGALELGS